MEFYIIIYCVTVNKENKHYGKAGVASTSFGTDWEKVKAKIETGYRTTFSNAGSVTVQQVKVTKVSLQKYTAFVKLANGVYN